MSPEVAAALVAGLFTLVTFAVTHWVKVRLLKEFEIEKQRIIEEQRAAIADERALSKYFETYFVKLDEALMAYADLCLERNLALDTKGFVPLYSFASSKWGDFKTYSGKKETMSFSEEFIRVLAPLKDSIERLTIALSMDAATRLKRRKSYEKLLAFAKLKRDELVRMSRAKRAGAN